jgi:hypothetical protein
MDAERMDGFPLRLHVNKAALHVKSLINAKYKMLFSGKVMEYERRETRTASVHPRLLQYYEEKGMHISGAKRCALCVSHETRRRIYILSGFISVDQFQGAL